MNNTQLKQEIKELKKSRQRLIKQLKEKDYQIETLVQELQQTKNN